MQPQYLYLTIFILLSILVIAVFGFVYDSTKNPDIAWKVKSAYFLRTKFFYVLSSVIVLLLAFTFTKLPYPTGKPNPDVVVPVEARMFSFDIKTPNIVNGTGVDPELPVGKLVEFRVTSADVTHDFGIYSPEGEIIDQVQAMPGYVNRLRLKFDKPGTYEILCLEYCGVAHQAMRSEIVVK